MKRMCIALFLSLCLHFALLGLIVRGTEEIPPREILRVSLQDAPQGGGGGGGGDTTPKGAAHSPSVKGIGPKPAAPERNATQPKLPVRQPQTVQPPPKRTQLLSSKAPSPPDKQETGETPSAPRDKMSPPFTSSLTGEESAETEGGARGSGPGLGGEGSGMGSGIGSGGGSGAASPGIVDAASLKVLKKKTPDYPMISRKRKDQGTVVLLIQIERGLVSGVEIERSSGHTALDESAANAVREWRFDATGYGDSLIARISFAFSLK